MDANIKVEGFNIKMEDLSFSQLVRVKLIVDEITIADLAEMMGVGQPVLSGWINGTKKIPSMRKLQIDRWLRNEPINED